MIEPSPSLLSGLKARYGEAQRAYHTWDHIEALLGHFQALGDHIHDKTRILWALYWHDAIYDPTRPDNEAVSADLLRAEGKSKIPDDTLEEAAMIIDATAKHLLPESLTGHALSDAAYFLDMDLSVLAARADVFDTYEDHIRFEYSFVPKETYTAARASILKGFLAREHLYFTDQCRKKWEDKARAKLARSIAKLNA